MNSNEEVEGVRPSSLVPVQLHIAPVTSNNSLTCITLA